MQKRALVIGGLAFLLIGVFAGPAGAFSFGARTGTPGNVQFDLASVGYNHQWGPVFKMGESAFQLAPVIISPAPPSNYGWTASQNVDVSYSVYLWSGGRWVTNSTFSRDTYSSINVTASTRINLAGTGTPKDVYGQKFYTTAVGHIEWFDVTGRTLLAQEWFWPDQGGPGFLFSYCTPTMSCVPGTNTQWRGAQFDGTFDLACQTFAEMRGDCLYVGLRAAANLNGPTRSVDVVYA